MSAPNYTRFLAECVIQALDRQPGPPEEEIYGVYLSWCILSSEKPGSSTALWAAMSRPGHAKQTTTSARHFWPGLTMTGPAAVDYILTSQPSLI